MFDRPRPLPLPHVRFKLGWTPKEERKQEVALPFCLSCSVADLPLDADAVLKGISKGKGNEGEDSDSDGEEGELKLRADEAMTSESEPDQDTEAEVAGPGPQPPIPSWRVFPRIPCPLPRRRRSGDAHARTATRQLDRPPTPSSMRLSRRLNSVESWRHEEIGRVEWSGWKLIKHHQTSSTSTHCGGWGGGGGRCAMTPQPP